MKKYIYRGIALSAAALLCGMSAMAQQTTGITVDNAKMTRNASLMSVSMDMDMTELDLPRNSSAVFVPVIVNGDKHQELPGIGIYGRTRWYQLERSGKNGMSGAAEQSYSYSRRPSTVNYTQNVPYQEWMNGSKLILTRRDYGCCCEQTADYSTPLSSYFEKPYAPEYRYVRPAAETVKTRSMSGHAFIDFPVNRAELQPDYRGNRAELSKIIASIDSVRNDSDITVQSLAIKGFASPEGSYANNERLAKARTEALKKYVSNLYNFGDNFIATSYEAEDWAGLRSRVEASNLTHKAEILALIDNTSLTPDAREQRIKQNFPEEYKIMLDTYYPALRHSDYRIEYTVVSYVSVERIREIMATAAQNLSLAEMYMLAESCDPQSDEYKEIFETAVRLFPDDPTANLNAANVAMSRGELGRAERYLNKAGESAEAVYARGVLAGLQGDAAKAEELIRRAGSLGLSGADDAVELLRSSVVR